MEKTASRNDVPFQRHLGASTSSEVRADGEHVLVFTSELGNHMTGPVSDHSRASFE